LSFYVEPILVIGFGGRFGSIWQLLRMKGWMLAAGVDEVAVRDVGRMHCIKIRSVYESLF